MRRPAWQHMMDLRRAGLATRHTPPQAMTASNRAVTAEWVGMVPTYVTHSRRMAALYNVGFTK